MTGQVVELEIVLSSPLPLNSNQRMHPMAKAEKTRKLRDYVERIARSKPTSIPTPTHLTVRLGHPTRTKRDSLNCYPTIKACIDGLVRAGWLEDDDDEHLVGPDFRPYIAGRKGEVVLTFVFRPIAVDEQLGLLPTTFGGGR